MLPHSSPDRYARSRRNESELDLASKNHARFVLACVPFREGIPLANEMPPKVLMKWVREDGVSLLDLTEILALYQQSKSSSKGSI
jgi:hypothetical protein